jgi:hypothetical protein
MRAAWSGFLLRAAAAVVVVVVVAIAIAASIMGAALRCQLLLLFLAVAMSIFEVHHAAVVHPARQEDTATRLV